MTLYQEQLSSPAVFWWGLCCPIMCLYGLSSVLWCPLQFTHKNDIWFVITPVVCRKAHALFTLRLIVNSGAFLLLFVFVLCLVDLRQINPNCLLLIKYLLLLCSTILFLTSLSITLHITLVKLRTTNRCIVGWWCFISFLK